MASAAAERPPITASRMETRPQTQCTRRLTPSANQPARDSSPNSRRKGPGAAPSAAVRIRRAARQGITVMETARLSRTAKLMAMAMSLKSCPASSSTKITGRKTATVVSVLASTAPQTSRAPFNAACRRLCPSCRCR